MVSTPMPNDQSQWAQNQPQQPSYLQQQPSIAAPSQGIANLIKALYAGNDAYNAAHPAGAGPAALAPGSAVPGAMGPTAVGGPMGPSPLNGGTDPNGQSGGLGSGPMAGNGIGTGGFMGMPTQGAASLLGAQGVPMGGAADMMAPQAPVVPDYMTQALMSPIPGM